MKIQGFLDHLLKSAQGGGASGNAADAAPAPGGLGGLLNADFGKGALAGGALGLLLGKNKTTRKLATYGGLAANVSLRRHIAAALPRFGSVQRRAARFFSSSARPRSSTTPSKWPIGLGRLIR